jgi:hypothetical protein
MDRERPAEKFPQSVLERIGFYVYALRDPRDRSVFYIGKGTGNRVFQHAAAAVASPLPSDKLDRIREIRSKDMDVVYEIIRHGMTEDQALAVESALIDWTDGLTNEVAGHGASRQGRMTVPDIIAQYAAEPVTLSEPCILVIVNRLFERNMSPDELYEATRGNWVIGTRRSKAQYALAVFRGIVRAAYRIEKWEPATALEPDQKQRSRWRFTGEVARNLNHLVSGDVTRYLGKASQNPIRYANC